jgi:hypothetical protein
MVSVQSEIGNPWGWSVSVDSASWVIGTLDDEKNTNVLHECHRPDYRHTIRL